MMKTLIIMAIMMLTACSMVSPPMEFAPEQNVALKQVKADPASYMGQSVRWGGKILSVNNYPNYSEIQLVEFPLNYRSRPVVSTQSQGRFLIRSGAFLDPEIYQVGLMLTAQGEVKDLVTLQVDQKVLSVPVISLEQSHVWSKNNAAGLPHNPKHDLPFVGLGYYGTGSYSP